MSERADSGQDRRRIAFRELTLSGQPKSGRPISRWRGCAMLSLPMTGSGHCPPSRPASACRSHRDAERCGGRRDAALDLGIWETVLPRGSWSRDVYIVAGDFAPRGHLKARMFAPADGVPEDPATGSAERPSPPAWPPPARSGRRFRLEQ